jgi:hypothetical protein
MFNVTEKDKISSGFLPLTSIHNTEAEIREFACSILHHISVLHHNGNFSSIDQHDFEFICVKGKKG